MSTLLLAGIILACGQLPGEGVRPEQLETPIHKQDLMRFPCEWVAVESLKLAEAHVAHVQALVDFSKAQLILGEPTARHLALEQWLCEANRCRAAWVELRGAWQYRTSEYQSDIWLVDLRKKIGQAAYDRGLMPTPIPLAYCRRIN